MISKMIINLNQGYFVRSITAGLSQADCQYKFKPHGNSCYLIVTNVLATWLEAQVNAYVYTFEN